MQKDRHLKIEKIGHHIPEFPGYRAVNFDETDRQLRHFLHRRLDEIRDDLRESIEGLPSGGAPRQALGDCLRQLEEIGKRLEEPLSPQTEASATRDQEEALLDFDLNLLDKTAALSTAVGDISRLGGGPATQTLLTSLIEDLEDLLHQRAKIVETL
jgi:hypothetical protein